jgi:hypothetical protein
LYLIQLARDRLQMDPERVTMGASRPIDRHHRFCWLIVHIRISLGLLMGLSAFI